MPEIQYTIVIPTYQECENLSDLLPAIDKQLGKESVCTEIIVVDDNSCDGTKELCRQLSEKLSVSLQLLTRTEERGLATAVIHGLKASRGESLLVMDADFSHPVAMIRDMFTELFNHETDFVVASRYVSGASIEGGWGITRWLNSKAATLLAVPLVKVKDPMSGFFAFRRSLVSSWDQLDPVGYKIGLELLVKCEAKSIREIPIHFANRKHGDSKLDFGQQLDYLRHLLRLYQHRYKHMTRGFVFTAVGAIGAVTDFTIFFLASLLMPLGIARVVGILAAITQNFLLHRRVTFSDAPQPGLRKQYGAYLLSCAGTAALNWCTFMGLVSLGARPIWAVAVLGVVIASACNFAISSLAIFNIGFWKKLSPESNTEPAADSHLSFPTAQRNDWEFEPANALEEDRKAA